VCICGDVCFMSGMYVCICVHLCVCVRVCLFVWLCMCVGVYVFYMLYVCVSMCVIPLWVDGDRQIFQCAFGSVGNG